MVGARGVRASLLLLGGVLLASACALREPVVSQQRPPPPRKALQRVAVAEFSSGPALVGLADDAGRAMVASVRELVTAELLARGLSLIPSDEFVVALAESGEGATSDLALAARVAAEKFEATALLMGHVSRYDERVGSSRSSSRPASVAFQLTLRGTPDGRILWRGGFDQTQHELSYRPMEATRLPGGGVRWITADELARWGVQRTVAAMLGEG